MSRSGPPQPFTSAGSGEADKGASACAVAGDEDVFAVTDDSDFRDIPDAEADHGGKHHVGPRAAARHVVEAEREVNLPDA